MHRRTPYMSIDEQWLQFIRAQKNTFGETVNMPLVERPDAMIQRRIPPYWCPVVSDIRISTKTIMTTLVHESAMMNIMLLFWKLPVIPYHHFKNGIVKKKIAFILTNEQMVADLLERVRQIDATDIMVKESRIASKSRTSTNGGEYKDTRSVCIGLSKKNIMYKHKRDDDVTKKKQEKPENAFGHCIALIVRVFYDSLFREYHVKLFQTGNVEIPGTADSACIPVIMDELKNQLSSFMDAQLIYTRSLFCTILINSAFRCNFTIHLKPLISILNKKYHILATFDKCSSPGIQCKFYYNTHISPELQTGVKPDYEPTSTSTSDIKKKNKTFKIKKQEMAVAGIKEITFIIFRTGGVLVVGKCNEFELMHIYKFIKRMLVAEYETIYNTSVNLSKEEGVEEKKKFFRNKKYGDHVMAAIEPEL
jgi:hypothetical protein